jgi:P4 family phage/plasmid primase-like protien
MRLSHPERVQAMPHDPVESLLSRLTNVQQTGEREWSATCPVHDDSVSSLHIGYGRESGHERDAMLNCKAGCETKSILDKVGLGFRDLFATRNGQAESNGHARTNGANGHAKQKRRIDAVYHYRDESGVVLFDVVRFEPKTFRQGQPKERGGWTWNVQGVRRVLYRLPELTKASPSRPVFIVEGEKDVHALESMSALATTNAGGAGKWTAEYNESFRGRNVFIVPDNDDPGRKHAQQVAAQLHGIATRVRILELPDLPVKGDVSDWIAAGGTVEKLKAMMQATPDWQPSANVATDARPHDATTAGAEMARAAAKNSREFSSQIDAERLSDEYLHVRPRHALVNSSIYRHTTAGRFAEQSETHLRAEVREDVALRIDAINKEIRESKGDEAKLYSVNCSLVSNVIDAIKSQIQRAECEPPFWLKDRGRSRNCLVVGNGILDVDRLIEGGAGPFFNHTADFFTTVAIPYAYDPHATCPVWQAFLQRNLEGDASRIAILQEFFGYCLTPDTSFHAFLMMHGEGSNGKSVACSVLRGMLGNDSISTVPLEAFGERFQLFQTLGKLANICTEVGEIDKVAEGHLKSFVSGDPMSFERKFRDNILARPTAKLVLATNTLPRIADRTQGIWRRMIVMPFTVVIGKEERIRGLDSTEHWAGIGELPGVLNWAIDGLRRLLTQGDFTKSKLVEEAREEFRSEVNPARRFLLDSYHESPDVEIEKQVAYTAYKSWSESTGHRPLADGPFGKEVLRVFPRVQAIRRQIAGKRVQLYVGLCEGVKPAEVGLFDTVHQGEESDDIWK